MARPNKEAVVAREQEAWRLRLRGWTQCQIAAELKVDQSTISDYLKRRNQALAEEFTEEAREVKAQQTAQLEHIYAEAVAAWEQSKLPAERTQVVTGRAVASQFGIVDLPDLETTTTEGQSGNPALLAAALKAKADIRAIWGMDAPKKADITSGGAPFKIYAGFDPEAV